MSSPALEPFCADFPEQIAAYDDLERNFAKRAAQLTRAAAPLSIGIIGQVKAGKSSFLNALLFDGTAVLPKAATPKTANLTRIRYGEQAALRVSFYSEEEWEAQKELAASAREDDATRAARDLVCDARERGTPLAECLAEGSRTHTLGSVAELQAVLNDYVGVDGRYTPVVAATEIDWPHSALQGIEIVDTPGVNDPIHSRVQKTRDYLAACDVVFLLSRASNFLDEHDVGLFAQRAPDKGVKRLLLVGTQFDSAVLDDGYDRDSFAATRANLHMRLSRQASKSLAPAADRLRTSGRADLADRVAAAAQRPLFMSSFAHAFAERMPEDWEDDQRHVHAAIAEMARDTWGEDPPGPDQWRELAGFGPLRQELDNAIAEKEAILAEQRAKLEPDRRRSLAQWAKDSSEKVSARLAQLETKDLAKLASGEAELMDQMRRIATALSALIGETVQGAQARGRALQGELRAAAARAATLETRTGHDIEERSTRVSDSKWYNPFSWGSSHYEYYTVTKAYSFVAVSDAIDQVVGYVRQAEAELTREIGGLASAQSLSARLRGALVDVIDAKDDSYDPLYLRSLVTEKLNAVVWPQWTFILSDPTADIISRFGTQGEIRSDADMNALRRTLDTLIADLNRRLASALDEQVAGLCRQLETVSAGLEASLTEKLKADLSDLRKALAEGEAAKSRYRDFLMVIQTMIAV